MQAQERLIVLLHSRMNYLGAVVGCLLAAMAGYLQAQDPEPANSRHALIVVGLTATDGYDQTCMEWARRLVEDLTKNWGFRPSELTLAWPYDGESEPDGAARVAATKPGLEEAIRRIASILSEEGRFYMFVFGSGSYDGREYKLNLKGPDLTGIEAKKLLEGIKSRRQAVFWGTSSSGEMVPLLSKEGRVVVSATHSGRERHDPRFPGYFLESLGEESVDTDKNRRISWLEAYLAARTKTDQSFKNEGHLATEHPLLEDSGDGKGQGLPSEENGEGVLAAVTYFRRMEAAGKAAESNSRYRQLVNRRDQIESAIQQLKGRRQELATAGYEKQMEELLVTLARVSAQIRSLEAEPKKPF